MDSIIKVFLTVFCLLLVTLTGTGLIKAAMEASQADGFLADAVKEIEQGNFQNIVMEDCVAEANARGYDLTCGPIDTDGDGYTDLVRVQLQYEYGIPFLQSETKTHVLRAYAR